jgi:hypothetical protein
MSDRINNKMRQSLSAGERSTKRVLLGERGSGGNRSIVKLYSCFFARARGLTIYLFFFIINRVRGLIVYITLYLGTYMRIYFEHLIREF